jgi:spermidine synthase
VTTPILFQPAADALYGAFWLMAVASDRLDPAVPDEATLAARAQARELDRVRFYDARLHAALLAAPQMARDKLGEFLQL